MHIASISGNTSGVPVKCETKSKRNEINRNEIHLNETLRFVSFRFRFAFYRYPSEAWKKKVIIFFSYLAGYMLKTNITFHAC